MSSGMTVGVNAVMSSGMRADQSKGNSPLAQTGLARFAGSEAAGLVLRDRGVTPLWMLRADPSRNDVMEAVQTVLSVRLPGSLQSSSSGAVVVRWVSPDAWLVSVESEASASFESDVLKALNGHGAVVDVSGGYARLELSGPSLQDVLKMSTPYDVHPAHFTPGKVVSTTFAKATVLMRALAGGDCELLVRRSFADYAFRWLVDCSKEVGLRVV